MTRDQRKARYASDPRAEVIEAKTAMREALEAAGLLPSEENVGLKKARAWTAPKRRPPA